jgi:PTS system glucose-specific IIC component
VDTSLRCGVFPAAAFAIWHAARPENRAKIGGIMIFAALTAFLYRHYEPIEFALSFCRATTLRRSRLLAGAAYFVLHRTRHQAWLHFSHGFIDYVVLFPKSHNALWLI